MLYLNDCIIIPGLGGFVARYHPAKVDGLRRKLKPPCKEFTFDDTLVKGGDIAISFIAKVRGIKESEARTILERFSLETRAIVYQGDRAELPGLGWFFKGPKGKIHFEFNIPNNFHPETAGLPEISLPEFNKSERINMPEMTETKPAKGRSPLRHLAWILPLLLLVCGAGYVYLQWESLKEKPFISGLLGKVKSVNDDTDLQPQILMGLPDSASAVEQAIDTLSSMKNALVPGTEGKQVVKKDPYANCTQFYIIAGSFKRLKNAQELSEQYSRLGYKTEILTSTDGMYRVSLHRYSSRQEALKALDKMKAEGKLKNVWLLSI